MIMPYELSYRVPKNQESTLVLYVREEEDGSMWVTYGFDEVRVNYCPFTGTPAKKQMTVINKQETDLEGNVEFLKQYVD